MGNRVRNYSKVDVYLNTLLADIYDQPEDPLHSSWAREFVEYFAQLVPDCKTVLDAGCGTGFCQKVFEEHGISYTGICLGNGDYEEARRLGRNVEKMDFTFLSCADNSVDAIASRHSLEHSPIPLLTLMEWHRVTKKYVALVLPAPEHWRYGGRNHYFVLNRRQWKVLFEAAGFDVIYENVKRQNMKPDGTPPDVAIEYWFILRKKKNAG